MVQIWVDICRSVKRRLDKSVYEQWFETIVPLSYSLNELTLGVPDEFFAEWFENSFSDMICNEYGKLSSGGQLTLLFEAGHCAPQVEEASEVEVEDKDSPVSLKRSKAPNCLSRHTFENFVVGEENRYAYAAAETASADPGIYNPLYIYGGTGVGKTHLLQAVAHEVLSRNPSAIVRYYSCEEFLNCYVESLRSHNHSGFRNKVRKVDLLLIDDVHQLANKNQLQEEFFNTFNSLYNENKQIILTSDKQPCEISGLEDRLVSRFESGVTTEICAPGYETRLAILNMMSQELSFNVEKDVLNFMAARISSSVRRLKGALLRLVAISSALGGVNMTVEKAEEVLHKLIEEESASKLVSIESIQKAVASHFNIRMSDILSAQRPKNIAEPRMVAMYLSRDLTDHSFPEIGMAFGRNHATILNGCKKVKQLCDKNEAMRNSVSMLKRKLTSS